MKLLSILIGTTLLIAGVGAQAQTCSCTGSGNTQITNAALSTLLSGNTVCVPNSGGGWDAQEQHRAGGQLWDYKLGSSSTVDPTAQVGTWSVTTNGANSAVTHTYGTLSYTYKVCRVGTTNSYGFCPSTGGAVIMATIKSGQTSCP